MNKEEIKNNRGKTSSKRGFQKGRRGKEKGWKGDKERAIGRDDLGTRRFSKLEKTGPPKERDLSEQTKRGIPSFF